MWAHPHDSADRRAFRPRAPSAGSRTCAGAGKGAGQGAGQGGDEEVSGSVALPLVNDALVVLGWSPEERGAIVEALGQLSLGDEDVASWPCRWVSSGGGGGGGGGDELIQMHDMLVTRGVSVLHPEHALHISSQRI